MPDVTRVSVVALLGLLLFVISMNLSRAPASTTKISSQLTEQLGLSNSRWGSGGEASVLKEEVTELRKRVKDLEKHLTAIRSRPAAGDAAAQPAAARPVEATAVVVASSSSSSAPAAAAPAGSTAVAVAATAVVTTGQRVAPPVPPNTVGMASWWSDQEVQVAGGG